MECKNCSQGFDGRFCPACGQKVIAGRITVRSLFVNLFTTITNLEKGFWHTMVRLFTRPDQVIRDFLGGSTIRYVDPFRYLFLWSSISALITLSFNLLEFQSDEMVKIGALKIQQTGKGADTAEVMAWVKRFLNIVPFLIIPFLALAGQWIFRRLKYNYAEHLAINGFLFGQVTLINLIALPVIFISPVFVLIYSGFSTLSNFVYYGYAFRKLGSYSVLGVVWRSLALYIASNALMAAIAMIISMIIIALL
ncbi:MAG: DUF3667 domain-containing protein [Lewinellaceae bacterium]|nr:DUF3667 domain-containing protein [Lewinella sp.]MCB9280371.1 DUF3667 domain-containing protein [Lewinellaceae bacterium]